MAEKIKHARKLTTKRLHRTADPLLGYMFRQAETYSLGYVPTDIGGAPAEEILEQVRTDCIEILRELFGPSLTYFTEMVGINKMTLKHVQRQQTNTHTPYHIRVALLTALTHMAGIREHIYELEKKTWVALQLTHHPLLAPGHNGAVSTVRDRRTQSRAQLRRQIGKLPKRHVTVKKNTVLMPLRIAAKQREPHLPMLEAAKRELERMEAERPDISLWKHSARVSPRKPRGLVYDVDVNNYVREKERKQAGNKKGSRKAIEITAKARASRKRDRNLLANLTTSAREREPTETNS